MIDIINPRNSALLRWVADMELRNTRMIKKLYSNKKIDIKYVKEIKVIQL